MPSADFFRESELDHQVSRPSTSAASQPRRGATRRRGRHADEAVFRPDGVAARASGGADRRPQRQLPAPCASACAALAAGQRAGAAEPGRRCTVTRGSDARDDAAGRCSSRGSACWRHARRRRRPSSTLAQAGVGGERRRQRTWQFFLGRRRGACAVSRGCRRRVEVPSVVEHRRRSRRERPSRQLVEVDVHHAAQASARAVASTAGDAIGRWRVYRTARLPERRVRYPRQRDPNVPLRGNVAADGSIFFASSDRLLAGRRQRDSRRLPVPRRAAVAAVERPGRPPVGLRRRLADGRDAFILTSETPRRAGHRQRLEQTSTRCASTAASRRRSPPPTCDEDRQDRRRRHSPADAADRDLHGARRRGRQIGGTGDAEADRDGAERPPAHALGQDGSG